MSFITNSLQKFIFRNNQTHVGGYRLNNNTRYLFTIFFETIMQSILIVVRQNQSLFCQCRRNAGAGRLTKRHCSRACLNKQAVGMTMVAAFKLNNFIPFCNSSCKSYGTHCCFGSGINKANFFRSSVAVVNNLCKFSLKIYRRSK